MPSWKLTDRVMRLESAQVMGILNVTPDSFSDGGRYATPQAAAEAALAMQAAGAAVIDVGGQSTRPEHTPVSAEEEWQRLCPVLEVLAGRLTVPVSVDTYYPSVAERALAMGVQIINDVSGSLENGMLAVAANSGAGLVMTCPAADSVEGVTLYFERALAAAEAAGMDRQQVCLDVGIGFGKTRELDMELIRRLPALTARFPRQPFLIGGSRKRVVATFTGANRPPSERLAGTLALHTLAQVGGAHLLRVHDVPEACDAVRLTEAFLERSKKE